MCLTALAAAFFAAATTATATLFAAAFFTTAAFATAAIIVIVSTGHCNTAIKIDNRDVGINEDEVDGHEGAVGLDETDNLNIGPRYEIHWQVGAWIGDHNNAINKPFLVAVGLGHAV